MEFFAIFIEFYSLIMGIFFVIVISWVFYDEIKKALFSAYIDYTISLEKPRGSKIPVLKMPIGKIQA